MWRGLRVAGPAVANARKEIQTMPRLKVPESDDARAAFMATAIRTAAADAAKGIFYIPAPVVTAAGGVRK